MLSGCISQGKCPFLPTVLTLSARGFPIPTIVNEALEFFGDVFDNEPARRHFAEYLTGLMVASRNINSAINRQITTMDQSCFNR